MTRNRAAGKWAGRSTSLLYRRVVDLLVKGQAHEARQLLEAAMSAASARPIVWSLLASVHEYEGRRGLADRLLIRAARRFPKSAEIRLDRVELAAEHTSWATVFRLAKRLERAIVEKRVVWRTIHRREDFHLIFARAAGQCRGLNEELSVLGRALSAQPESQIIRVATAKAIGRAQQQPQNLKSKPKQPRGPRRLAG